MSKFQRRSTFEARGTSEIQPTRQPQPVRRLRTRREAPTQACPAIEGEARQRRFPARPPGLAPRATPAAHRGRDRDRGQAAIEFIGFLPILLLIALAGVQLGLVAYTAAQSGTAARAAARTASQDTGGSPAAAGRNAISGWLADGATFAESNPDGEVTVTATLQIPSVIPGVNLGSVERSSTMPRADD